MRNKSYLKFRSNRAETAELTTELQAVVGNMPAPVPVLDEFAQEYQPRFQLVEDSTTVIETTHSHHDWIYISWKRILDMTMAAAALVAFAIMLPLIALAIKFDSPGPIFFKQERVGLNRRRIRRQGFNGSDRRKVLQPGRPFKIFKLRTMRIDAEANGPQWASRQDSRITRVGRVLRMSRLDEVPQFINVMRGEMSVIGPRPERLYFIRQLEKDVPNYKDRLLVRPGITGLAQVLNGYDTSTESVKRKVELDCQYIKKASIVTDLRIMLSTVRVVITGDGAC